MRKHSLETILDVPEPENAWMHAFSGWGTSQVPKSILRGIFKESARRPIFSYSCDVRLSVCLSVCLFPFHVIFCVDCGASPPSRGALKTGRCPKLELFSEEKAFQIPESVHFVPKLFSHCDISFSSCSCSIRCGRLLSCCDKFCQQPNYCLMEQGGFLGQTARKETPKSVIQA